MAESLTPAWIETDALVIGAGPVGLFQVFQLGLQEVKAHVVDTLEYPGGQCVALYAHKPIYDIPGVPVCTGQELTDSLLQQIAPLGAVFHFGQEIVSIQHQDDQRFFIETSTGTRFLAKTIFIAAGVGAFQARALKVEGLHAFEGTQIFYRVNAASDFAGKDLLILGGEDAALDAAIAFTKDSPHKARSVVLLHRRETLKADPEKIARIQALCADHAMAFLVGQVTGHDTVNGRLSAVKVTGVDGLVRSVALDAMLVFLGLSPKLGPIAQWGLALERKQLVVDTEKFSTSVPGIFAVGDINTYPGKKKLILCGFHECTLAAFAAMERISPEKQIFLQYTTTSPKLHKVLGVDSPVLD